MDSAITDLITKFEELNPSLCQQRNNNPTVIRASKCVFAMAVHVVINKLTQKHITQNDVYSYFDMFIDEATNFKTIGELTADHVILNELVNEVLGVLSDSAYEKVYQRYAIGGAASLLNVMIEIADFDSKDFNKGISCLYKQAEEYIEFINNY